MRRRLRATGAWQQRCNEGAKGLNHLYGSFAPPHDNVQSSDVSDSGTATMPTKLQQLVLGDMSNQYKALGRPPADLAPAGAFTELCGSAGPYLFDHGGPAPFQAGNIALPEEPPSCSVDEAIASEHIKPLDTFGDTIMQQSSN